MSDGMLLIAHRTPRTAAGCLELVDAGAQMFETDVQLAGDTVKVSHYLPIRWLRGLLQEDNGRFRIGAGPPYDLTLNQTLGLIPASCGVLLDPKEKDPTRRTGLVVALGRELRGRPDRDRFVVSTGNEDDLVAFRGAGFRTWRTLKTAAELTRALSGDRLVEEGVSARHTLLRGDVVERLHTVTDTVVAWTVNNPARGREIRDLGVDGITTDSREVMSAARRAAPGNQ